MKKRLYIFPMNGCMTILKQKKRIISRGMSIARLLLKRGISLNEMDSKASTESKKRLLVVF